MIVRLSYLSGLTGVLLSATCAGFVSIKSSTQTKAKATSQLFSDNTLIESSDIPFEEWESAMTPKATNFDDVFVSKDRISFHHACIKTRDIVAAIKFYGLLGFKVSRKFMLPGSARGVWMEHEQNSEQRLEFIEIPKWNLNEAPGKRRQAIDLLDDKFYNLMGYNHIALDVTGSMKEKGMTDLCTWIDYLNQTSIDTYGKHIVPALMCERTIIIPSLYDLAMIRDPDGCLVELVNHRKDFDHEMLPEW